MQYPCRKGPKADLALLGGGLESGNDGSWRVQGAVECGDPCLNLSTLLALQRPCGLPFMPFLLIKCKGYYVFMGLKSSFANFRVSIHTQNNPSEGEHSQYVDMLYPFEFGLVCPRVLNFVTVMSALDIR